MTESAIRRHIAAHCPGTDIQRPAAGDPDTPAIAVGDTFFIYDPDHDPALGPTGPHRFPFATIVTKDYGDFDNASNLDRPGVFRLNIGLPRRRFLELFGPAIPEAGPDGVVRTGHDFTALDTLMPHPVYAAHGWVCVLNPSAATFRTLEPLLAEAYADAVRRYDALRRGASA